MALRENMYYDAEKDEYTCQNSRKLKVLLREKKKVETEIAIVAMEYNINKLHHKIQDNRTGTQLHGELSA